jgi:lipopolysaccharide/colanic/teichoic acid biosynthesis glycosyltransferase
LDLTIAVIALPFFFLLCVIVIPLIKLEDRGSAFYIAKRLGMKGRSFDMYKFRSMVPNAPDIRLEDGSTYNAADDARLTKIGRFLRKTSLDETPQLINVLKGDMSIVGPRPDLPSQRSLYTGSDYLKLDVRPGITGYSQAYYRNAIPWKQRLKHDAYYTQHVSFTLDVRIVLKTISTVISGRSVFIEKGSPK